MPRPSVDTQTGTLMVRGILPNADHALLPGFFVRVRVPLQRQQAEALLVPDTALGTDQAGRYLLVVDKDDVVQQRTVKSGRWSATLRVINSGLKPDGPGRDRRAPARRPGAKGDAASRPRSSRPRR